MTQIVRHSALVLVDIQNDFCPGGALAVPNGHEVIPPARQYIQKFLQASQPIFFTRDWHPVNHCSFKARGGPWPPHCVQNTPGAAFHPDLPIPSGSVVISKASDPDQDAYSGFEGTDLAQRLKSAGIRRIYVGGLATDYCVHATVLDGLKHGFEVYWCQDASRGVEVRPGDSRRAADEMTRAGATIIQVNSVDPMIKSG